MYLQMSRSVVTMYAMLYLCRERKSLLQQAHLLTTIAQLLIIRRLDQL